ncbi:MAG TPA: multiheme c-type cytochrome, partial [Armatimonadota bacterium]|nr:multiheme c-type cytochrome [Armatimonadota bacterium]
GKHGMTLVASPGAGRYMELPLSHYPGRGWDLTPGYLAFTPERRMLHPAGVPSDHTQFRQCFFCHATGVESTAADLDTGKMVLGVQCEHCHGPGEAHVRAADLKQPLAGTIRSPGKESAVSLARLCGECHRTEPAPGIQPDSPLLVRFAPVGLMRSRCFRESDGRLSCTSCHDPHTDVPLGTAEIERRCQSCHSEKTTLCPVNRVSGCVSCHMPKAEAVRNSFFTDHWIRVHPDQGTAAKPGAREPGLPFGH